MYSTLCKVLHTVNLDAYKIYFIRVLCSVTIAPFFILVEYSGGGGGGGKVSCFLSCVGWFARWEWSQQESMVGCVES